jgi:4-amino-4-deoxy-L-arabinose transferase-like glycosyltransferase
LNRVSDKQALQILMAVVAASFAIRVVGFLLLTNWQDEVRMEEFHIIARHLIAGDGFAFTHPPLNYIVPSAYMPPGYPLFIAGLILLLGDGTALIVTVLTLQAIVGALVAVPMFWIARRLFGTSVAVVAIVMSLCYPIFQFYTADYSSTPYYILFSLLCFHSMLCVRDQLEAGGTRGAPYLVVLAGVFFGLWAALRGEALLYLPAPLLILYAIRPWRRLALYACMFGLGLLTVMGPWWVRNRIVFDEWVLTPTAGRFGLFRGQNRLATGGAYGPWMGEREDAVESRALRKASHDFQDPDSDPDYAVHPPEVLERWAKLDPLPDSADYELQLEARYKEEALRFMRENPGAVVRLALVKFVYLWWRDPTHPVSHHPAYYIPWALLLPLFLVGLTQRLGFLLRREPWVLYLFACQTAICMVFLVQPRYRIFLDPLILTLAAIPMLWIFKAVHRQLFGSAAVDTQPSYCQKLWIGRSGNPGVDGRKEESVSSG